jgi:hypothetical protein
MAGLILPLSITLLIAFAGLCVIAILNLKKTELPSYYSSIMNVTHGIYALNFVNALAASGGTLGMRYVLEYLLVYVGAGVLYTRGLLPGGFMWRILTNPPKVPQGMAQGMGWCFAAILGYIFFWFSKGQRLG